MTGVLDAKRLAWPFVALDFESSGLVRHSYPIEVGICVWPSPDAPATTWSSLIAPDRLWLERGVWIDLAQTVHRIPRRALAAGLTPSQAMGALNDLVPIGGAVHCDGGSWDGYWMSRLSDAASLAPTFHLVPVGTVVGACSDGGGAYRADKERRTAHRAAPDAEAIVAGIAAALGRAEPDFVRTGP